MSTNEDAVELYNRARVFSTQNNFGEALDCLNKAIELDKMCKEFYLQKAVVYANMKEYAKSAAELMNALKIDKKYADAYFHLGNIFVLQGDKAKGMENYSKAVTFGYSDPQVYFNMALMYEDTDLNMALRYYSKVIMLDAFRTDARLKRADVLSKMKKYDDALQEASDIIFYAPELFDGYHLKANIQATMGKFEDAYKSLDEALEIFPGDYRFKFDRVNFLVMENKIDDAMASVDELLKVPDLAAAEKRHLWLERARVYAMQENIDEMIHAFEEAKRCTQLENPDDCDCEVSFLLASCCIKEKMYDKVIALSEELVKSDKMEYIMPALYYIPYCKMQKDGLDAAKESFTESIDKLRAITMKNPELHDGYFFRCLCLKEVGELDKAMDLCDYLIKVSPKNQTYYNLKAEVLHKMGKDSEAQALHNSVVNLPLTEG